MTEVQARRMVCEAALLDDSTEAAALLRQALDTLTETSSCQDEVLATLLLAYAWVAPHEALLCCQEPAWVGRTRRPSWLYEDWVPQLPFWVKQLNEAHALHALDDAGRTAYAAVTALLPTSEHTLRRGAQKLVLALDSSKEFLTLPNWEAFVVRYDGLNVFLAARLWKECPQLLWEKLQDLPRFAPLFYPIGQWVLSAQYRVEDLPLLIAITGAQRDKRGNTYNGSELSAVFKSLEMLEVHAPQELKRILPAVLKVIGRGSGEGDSVLTAYTLALVVRRELDGAELIRPLITRVRGRKSIAGSRRWARHVQRRLRQYEPAHPQAQALSYLLRVMALERTIDSLLVRPAPGKTTPQIYRAWRWLLRSERVISAVKDKGWREYLHTRKALLISKVSGSRKARHTGEQKRT